MNYEQRTTNYRQMATLFDICRGFSTNQPFFMQNEPNLPKAQMNVNKVLIKDYEDKTNWTLGENEPKTNPNEPNFKKAEMNVTSIITVGYKNKSPNRATKNEPNLLERQQSMQTSLPQRIMKNTELLGSDKTNPNKAKQTQFQPISKPKKCCRV